LNREHSISTRAELGRALSRACYLRGEFRLRSGAVSSEYFDKYRFESNPELLYQVALGLSGLLPDEVEGLAGLELGGVPVATVLSQITRLPLFFVRKAAKDYGTCRIVEGGEVGGRRIVVVEDVITSGGQVVKSSRELRGLGAVIIQVLCVVDREIGGAEALIKEGLELKALYRMSDLVGYEADEAVF
jgi:orotate phosphoribosyltransferase